MTDLPRIIASQPPPLTEELTRIVEAYQREHDMPVAGSRHTAELCNAAINWWNAGAAGRQEDET